MSEPNFFTPELPDDTIYHVGVSGGKDSTAVLLWMVHESGIPHHKIDATFADTGNENPLTLAHVALIAEKVFPITTIKPALGFYDLVQKKHIFPSSHRRYCTEKLKIEPAKQHITGLLATARKVVSVSGVRADESIDRRSLEEWDYSNGLLTMQWRPIIRWSIADVLAIHERYGVPLNPLYADGDERVGCDPCIFAKKKQIRRISIRTPERIDFIRSQETLLTERTGNLSFFFDSSRVPERFRTVPYTKKDGETVMLANIDDVVRWSMTGKRARGSYLDDAPEPITCVSGFCE